MQTTNANKVPAAKDDVFEAQSTGEQLSNVLEHYGPHGHDFDYDAYVIESSEPPVARNDAFATDNRAPFVYDRTQYVYENVFADNGFGPDSDPEGDSLTVTSFQGSANWVDWSYGWVHLPGGGLARLFSNGNFLFMHNGEFDDLALGASRQTSFTYAISDGHGGTDTAVGTVTVTGANHAPVAHDDAFLATKTATFSGNVFVDNGFGADSDLDGDDLKVTSIEGSAANIDTRVELAGGGAVRLLKDGQLWFVPGGDFDDLARGETRQTSFTYGISDKFGGTEDTAVATITVGGLNNAPVARDDAFATKWNGTYSRNVLADNGFGPDKDPNGDPITVFSVEGSAANVGQRVDLAGGGAVRLMADGKFWFVPDGDFDNLKIGYSRDTSFSYGISDGHGGTDTAVASFRVYRDNQAPVANDDDFVTTSIGTYSSNVFHDNGHGADYDPDGATISVWHFEGTSYQVGERINLDDGGAVRLLADGKFWFDPDGDFAHLAPGESAKTSFYYEIIDSGYQYRTDLARATFTVFGPNQAPVANDDDFVTNPIATYSTNVLYDNGHGEDYDPEEQALTVRSFAGSRANVGERVDLAGGGAARLMADGKFWFVPDGDFADLAPGESAETGFDYVIFDGLGGTDTAHVSFTVFGPDELV